MIHILDRKKHMELNQMGIPIDQEGNYLDELFLCPEGFYFDIRMELKERSRIQMARPALKEKKMPSKPVSRKVKKITESKNLRKSIILHVVETEIIPWTYEWYEYSDYYLNGQENNYQNVPDQNTPKIYPDLSDTDTSTKISKKFYLIEECLENICTCLHGTPNTGIDCRNHMLESCVSCRRGYYLDPRIGMCRKKYRSRVKSKWFLP